ncbi:MAG: tetratricopeptide repeat protein [Rhodothermales bacterium]
MKPSISPRALFALLCLLAIGCGDRRAAPPIPDGDTAELLQAGEDALRQGYFEEALILADSAAARMPAAVEPLFLRGMIFTQTMRWDEAEASYQEVLKRDPEYLGAWNNLGNIALRQARVNDALTSYRNEIALHPAPRPWISVGRAYRELGMTDSATYAFDQALKLDSTALDAYLAYAQIREEEGEFDEGLRYARKAYARAPRNPDVQYVLGMLLTKTGNDAEAVEHLAAVTQVWPWHTESHYSLAQALQRLGRDEESARVLAEAEKLWQRQADVSFFQKAVTNDPDNAYNYAALGTALRLAGRFEDAVDAYKIALSLEGENLEFQNNLASLYFLQQDTLAAIRTYRAILQKDASMLSAWINLGVLHAVSGRPDLARQAWQQVLARDPQNEQAAAYIQRLDNEPARRP